MPANNPGCGKSLGMGCGGLVLFIVVLALLPKSHNGPAAQSTPAPNRYLGTGDTGTAQRAWPCMPTKDLLDEASKWMARGDTQELSRTILYGGGAILDKGDHFKVLDSGIIRARIRIAKNDISCWVPAEATNQ